MYNEFYGFKEYPFKLTPDPEFFYLSPIHKKALYYLTFGLETKQGFIQLTGEVGSGKSTIVRSLLKNLHKEAKVAYVVDPKLTFIQLLRSILSQLSIVTPSSTAAKDLMLEKLRKYLIEQAKLNCPVIIILDEAQNIDIDVLEGIRLLSNMETEKEKLLQIIFVGQPELRKILSLPELKQLKQRISTEVHIDPLNRTETEKYINHRLNIAGANGSIIFKKKACDEIYNYSNGIPRLINIACNATLLAGYVNEQKVFDSSIVREVISELTPDNEREDDTAAPSTDPATSTTTHPHIPVWKIALTISILVASLAIGVTLAFLTHSNTEKPEQAATIVNKSQPNEPELEFKTNQLEKEDGT